MTDSIEQKRQHVISNYLDGITLEEWDRGIPSKLFDQGARGVITTERDGLMEAEVVWPDEVRTVLLYRIPREPVRYPDVKLFDSSERDRLHNLFRALAKFNEDPPEFHGGTVKTLHEMGAELVEVSHPIGEKVVMVHVEWPDGETSDLCYSKARRKAVPLSAALARDDGGHPTDHLPGCLDDFPEGPFPPGEDGAFEPGSLELTIKDKLDIWGTVQEINPRFTQIGRSFSKAKTEG